VRLEQLVTVVAGRAELSDFRVPHRVSDLAHLGDSRTRSAGRRGSARGGALPVEVATQLAASAEPGDEMAITTLLKAAEAIAGPIVLVGLSYEGADITNAATGNAEVKELVYVDAFVPPQGETLQQLTFARRRSCLTGGGDLNNVFNFVVDPSRPPAWATIPSWALIGRHHRAIPPARDPTRRPERSENDDLLPKA
jgi:hypothetical protein